MRLLRAALRNDRIARLEAGCAAAGAGVWTFSIVLALVRLVLLEALALALLADVPFTLVLALAAAFELTGALARQARPALRVELARAPAELAAGDLAATADHLGLPSRSLARAPWSAIMPRRRR